MIDEIDGDAVFRAIGTLAPARQRAPANRLDGNVPAVDQRAAFSTLPDEDRASLICAARSLLRWPQERLAAEAGVHRRTLQRIETCEGNAQESTVFRVYGTLVAAGIEFTSNGRGDGLGVRRWHRE